MELAKVAAAYLLGIAAMIGAILLAGWLLR